MSTAALIDHPRPSEAGGGVHAWAREVAALTTPQSVVFCDGSPAERERLTAMLVGAGALVPVPGPTGALRCAPDPADAAQVGRHSYVCSRTPAAAGWAHWMEPVDMRIILTEEFRGAMKGRTMYVVPFRSRATPAGPPVQGVQITDSAYVVLCMSMMAQDHHAEIGFFGGDTDFVRCLHSVGAPRRTGQADVAWPCDTVQYIARFPEALTIWSYGSGFAGNAFLAGQPDVSGFWFGLATDDKVELSEPGSPRVGIERPPAGVDERQRSLPA